MMLADDPFTVFLAWAWLTGSFADVLALLFLSAAFVFRLAATPWRQFEAGQNHVATLFVILLYLAPSVVQTFFTPSIVPWYEYLESRDPVYVILRFIASLLAVVVIAWLARIIYLRRFFPERFPAFTYSVAEPPSGTDAR